jgi:hypothetical protein
MIFFNLDCNNNTTRIKPTATKKILNKNNNPLQSSERERENSQAIVELSSAIISSREPSSPLEERGG